VDDDLGTTTLSNKAIFGLFTAMMTAMVGIGGYNHYTATSSSSDRYTGRQGDAAEARIENIEKQLARFLERGPKDVTANQREIMLMGKIIIEMMREYSTQEVQVRKQHDTMAKNIKTMEGVLINEKDSDARFHRGMALHENLLRQIAGNQKDFQTQFRQMFKAVREFCEKP